MIDPYLIIVKLKDNYSDNTSQTIIKQEIELEYCDIIIHLVHLGLTHENKPLQYQLRDLLKTKKRA